MLKFYDPLAEVTLQCDARKYGLGATLLQDGQSVAFASRTLSPTERNYAQIEKECLAIVFGCQPFDQYHFPEAYSCSTLQTPKDAFTSIEIQPCGTVQERKSNVLG